MSTRLDSPPADPFFEAIRLAIRSEIERIANEETERAVKNVITRVSGELDRFALQMLSRYEIERMQHQIVIRVDKRALSDGELA